MMSEHDHERIAVMMTALRKIAEHDFAGCEHNKQAQCVPYLREMARAALGVDDKRENIIGDALFAPLKKCETCGDHAVRVDLDWDDERYVCVKCNDEYTYSRPGYREWRRAVAGCEKIATESAESFKRLSEEIAELNKAAKESYREWYKKKKESEEKKARNGW